MFHLFQIADLVYNSFSLGMEDHLLEIFGGHDTKEVITKALSTDDSFKWTPDAQKELNKMVFLLFRCDTVRMN